MAMHDTLAPMRDRILSAHHAKTPLRLRGAGSKDFFGEALIGEVLDTRGHAGIVDYEPSELVITARCGTPLAEIENVLAEHDQFLPFEPPAFGGVATLGGVVAAGLAGPRRASVGGVRDFVLGAHLLDANGELLRFGGQVMKNVAGFDVARLLCGSLGVLGLITQASLKVLPSPRAQVTVAFESTAANALETFSRYRAQPLPISAAAWHDGITYLRLSGSQNAVQSAVASVGGDCLNADHADSLWHSLREQTHDFFNAERKRLWRLSLPATAALAPIDMKPIEMLLEWSGALRWLRSDAADNEIRSIAEKLGGTAMLWHGARATTMFHPLPRITMDLHKRLKQQLDPHGIFNRGRMSEAF
jgi:glycolate oxidase FAD binding subunit